MSTIASTIFKQPLIGAPDRKSDARAAAQGFAEIFGSMVAKGMRSAFVGDDGGLGGTGDGGSDIYSAMFDQAIGKSLANSPAMKPLNKLLLREATGHGAAASAPHTTQVSMLTSGASGLKETASGYSSNAATAAISPGNSILPANNDRGPVLLPPEPASMAPVLPPPSLLEG
jgi:Rod binding domain-containing protein